jgi:hypothetical protein
MQKFLILFLVLTATFAISCEKEKKGRTAEETFTLLAGDGTKVWSLIAVRVNGQSVNLNSCEQQNVIVFAVNGQYQGRAFIPDGQGGCNQINENGTFSVIDGGNSVQYTVSTVVVSEQILELSANSLRLRNQNNEEYTYSFTP